MGVLDSNCSVVAADGGADCEADHSPLVDTTGRCCSRGPHRDAVHHYASQTRSLDSSCTWKGGDVEK